MYVETELMRTPAVNTTSVDTDVCVVIRINKRTTNDYLNSCSLCILSYAAIRAGSPMS